jgi:hypothetical protein
MGRGHVWSELLGRRNAFGEPFIESEAQEDPSLLDALAEIARGFGGSDRRGVRGGFGGSGRAPGPDISPSAPVRRSCCSTGRAGKGR